MSLGDGTDRKISRNCGNKTQRDLQVRLEEKFKLFQNRAYYSSDLAREPDPVRMIHGAF